MTSANPPPPVLPDTVDENAVRRLCGPAVFSNADQLQRDGHVLSPTQGERGLEASVRGTWRRVDRVTVQVKAGRLFPSCARDGDVFCRHVGALLLHYLRQPDAFADPSGDNDDLTAATPATYVAPSPPTIVDETPVAELARLLDQDTANHLRQVAKNHGVRLTGSRKADLVQQLTSALTESASIDQAIAKLSSAERLTLDAAHLLSAETAALVPSIQQGIRLFGGTDEPPFETLLDAGLIATPNRYSYGPDGYVVPRAVAAHLPPRQDLARRANDAGPTRTEARLGIIETIQVIAQTSIVEPIRLRERTRNRDVYHYMPTGFIFDPAEKIDESAQFGFSKPDGIRILPPRLLAEDALTRLRDRTGQSQAAIDFVARLLLALEIAHTTPDGLVIRFDRLQTMLDAPPHERLGQLAHAWLAGAGQIGLDPLCGPNGAISLKWHPMYATWMSPLTPAFAAAARCIARLVGRMESNEPYDLVSFVETIERLTPVAAPGLNQLRSSLKNNRSISMSARTHGGTMERLVLGPPEGWTNFISAVVTSFLTGPLSWLGFVEFTPHPGQPHVFRIRSEAGVLVDRLDGDHTTRQSGRLTVKDDLTVLVPPAAADLAIHGLLSRAGQLVDASRLGLRYQLTPAGIQAVFDSGVTGPELASQLADRTGGKLPAAVRRELDRLWQNYGTVRLYDELTIVELSDDFLLTELTAATSFASAIVETFSPRLIAIDSARADDIIAELADRGYAPRVIEES